MLNCQMIKFTTFQARSDAIFVFAMNKAHNLTQNFFVLPAVGEYSTNAVVTACWQDNGDTKADEMTEFARLGSQCCGSLCFGYHQDRGWERNTQEMYGIQSRNCVAGFSRKRDRMAHVADGGVHRWRHTAENIVYLFMPKSLSDPSRKHSHF